MNKEEFLNLASQLFDQVNPQTEETKIPLDKSAWDEIADQISSEIHDSGMDLIDDYELSMNFREVELQDVTFSFKDIESCVKNVLERYFEIK